MGWERMDDLTLQEIKMIKSRGQIDGQLLLLFLSLLTSRTPIIMRLGNVRTISAQRLETNYAVEVSISSGCFSSC